MPTVRSDANETKAFLTDLANENWLKNSARKWWPHFVFHFTDINNVANILKCGKLYSRNRLHHSTQNFIDIASPEVIQRTPAYYQDFVRLYFRPRTPTQFRNEGTSSIKWKICAGFSMVSCIFILRKI